MKKSDFPKIKKTLAFLLTFALLLSTAAAVMLVPASAAAVDVWDGTYADSYAGGTGTGSDPYLIATPEQLARMVGYDVLTNFTSNITNGSTGKYYKLTADIYLNDVSDPNWYTKDVPNKWYSSTTSRFCGSFDGGGYTIRGLYFAPDATNAGLFPAIDSWEADRYFKNITIADSYICASSMAGAIASRAYGGNNKTMYFEKCYIDDSVIVNATNTGGTAPWCGGFVGYSSIGDKTKYSFTNCASLASNTAGNCLKYGLVGINLTWYGELYYTVTNTFAYCESWQGLTSKATINNSYKVTDLTTIKGDAAKTAMPDLDWDNIWTVTADSYPVCLNLEGVKGEVWQGKVATGYAGGSGTETDPFIIETANQLAYMIKHDVMDTAANNASFSMGKYYKLAADIYLNDVSDPDWRKTPNPWYATTSGQRFGGNLDGDGYTIYGLYYDGDSTVGLIPYADLWSYDITVKNVIISDAYLKTTGDRVGTLIGYVDGNNNPGHTLTVSNCFVNDNVLVQSTNAEGYVGGFVGRLTGNAANTYNFIGCGSLADVKGTDWTRRAGLIGPIGNSANDSITVNIENCFAFPNLAIYSSGAGVEYTNSYPLGTQDSLLTILGDKAKETMNGFDWANGAFVPTKEGYPRLKSVSQRLGDINGDDKSNSQDIIILKKHFLGSETSWVVDMNSDGEQDIRDLVNLKKKAASFTESKDGFVPDGYDLVWNDEFYGRTIDNEKWSTDQTRMHETNELGCFDDDSVRTVNNGGLAMTAYANPNPGDKEYYRGKNYITTNSITTENRMSFRYGYLEVKAKVPYKEGCWPSLWLRNNNATQVEGVTGLDGYNMEVDIIEPFGYTDRNATTIHETGTGDHHNQSGQNYAFKNPENLADEYHVYGFLWTKEKMKFYLDGEVVAIYDMATLDRSQWKSNFDDTVNILFNNHLFTTSSEYKPSESNIIENFEGNLPSEFVVDYVRLYQNQDAGNALVLGK